MASPASPRLSASQLATLAELGDERTADVGDALYRIGDRRYPFIAIVEGEVAIVDEAGNEIARHGASGFLGELNLLSGQTVFVTAVVTQLLRYIASRPQAPSPGACLEAKRVCGERQQLLALTHPASVLSGSGRPGAT